jgi:alcohol dehydrogenase (NADP+)
MSWKYAGDELYPKDEHGQILLDSDVSLIDTWRAMESCVVKGLVRNIGLSNGTKRDLQTIMEECTIRPSINQVCTTLYMFSLLISSLIPIP